MNKCKHTKLKYCNECDSVYCLICNKIWCSFEYTYRDIDGSVIKEDALHEHITK